MERLRIYLDDPVWDRGTTRGEASTGAGASGVPVVSFTVVCPAARAFLSSLVRMLSDMLRAGKGPDAYVSLWLSRETHRPRRGKVGGRTWSGYGCWCGEEAEAWSLDMSAPIAVALEPEY